MAERRQRHDGACVSFSRLKQLTTAGRPSCPFGCSQQRRLSVWRPAARSVGRCTRRKSEERGERRGAEVTDGMLARGRVRWRRLHLFVTGGQQFHLTRRSRCCCCSQNSQLCAEEFHRRLQEATNFPLRPFVVPFLKVCCHPSFFHASFTHLDFSLSFSVLLLCTALLRRHFRCVHCALRNSLKVSIQLFQ